MAFGGSTFNFGGNNNASNNNQGTGFGGFGNNSSTLTGGNTGFGASTTGSNPFGGATSTFGANAGGFGGNNNAGTSLFGGNKSASSPFGGNNASSGGLFGSTTNNNTTTTGGFGSGGFGNTTNTTTNTGGFGGGTTGGSFSFSGSANKPAFGSASTTTAPLFGQGGVGTTGGFGGGGAFGSGGAGTALNQPVPACEGTNVTPFAPTIDKEQNGSTNSYQTITFQQPYQKYSLEELRLADYNAGRRFGNGSGQAGAFGTSSFGGFGGNNNTTTSGFGGSNTASNPFGGAATTSSTGFGGGTTTTGFGGGGLFGNNNNKPSGGLFGAQTTSSGTSGGLFGTTNNNTTTGGFGSGATGGFGNNTGTSGGLFGNNSAQNKPGGLFGNTNSTTTGTGNAFSFSTNNNNQTSNNAGSLFGNNNNNTATNTGSSLFGGNNQTQTNTGGLFGGAANQTKPSLFGGSGGFGTPSTQAQTSGGLFGNSNTNNNTSGGLFGNNTNNNNNNNNSTGGNLFGGGSNTGGGLFGAANNTTNTNNNTSGGLFGGGQTQNKPSLFGNINNTNSNGGGLFGGNNNTNTNTSGGLFGTNTGGLFGNNNANKPSTSLFGGSTTNQPNGSAFGPTNNGGSIFGNSQNNQQNPQQQDGYKHASLLDPNPYGQSSIWTGLPAPTPENAKPIFTPLTATQKMKESMMKPPQSLRLNQSRYMTPPRRNGFGFSYSTYGTPNSAASTPGGAGLSGSMYGSRGWSGGSFGRSFSKSASVQNLRAQFSSDGGDDIWKPGAFSSSHRNSSGSIKRLTIDRSIRNDLFSRPVHAALPAPEKSSNSVSGGGPSDSQSNGDVHADTSNKLKKRVSFDNNTSVGQLNGQTGALVRTESDDDSQSDTTAQENRTVNGNSNGNGNGQGQSSRSKELAVVPEDRESDHVSSRPAPPAQAKTDPKPGDYWMRPSRAEMSKLPRERLQHFKDFQVGRYGCGQVTFNGTVDLTNVPLDDLYDKIVEIRLRSVTVYPDASMKPPVGKGLNVPSTIAIENSWPRSRNQPSSATSGPVFDKHIDRLNKIPGTEFVDYEVSTGVWTFRVPHYTRYGLDYDDDDEDNEDMSELTPPPDSIEKSGAEESVTEVDGEEYEQSDQDDDDTFAFKQKTVPGGFGRQSLVEYEPNSLPAKTATDEAMDDGSEHSAYSEDDFSEDEPSMAGSYPAPALDLASPAKPILKAPGTPSKALLDLDGDWAEQLQRTISPRKQNRDILRDVQSKVLLDRAYSPIKPNPVKTKNFRTSVDVMSSIFGKYEEGRHSTMSGTNARRHGNESMDFEFPYAKRAKTYESDFQNMSESDRKWHENFPPKFTEVGDLIVRKTSLSTSDEILVGYKNEAVVKSRLVGDLAPLHISSLLARCEVSIQDDVPTIQYLDLPFSYLAEQLNRSHSADNIKPEDSALYDLAHILFDEYEDQYSLNLSSEQQKKLAPNILHDRLTEFLSSHILRKYADKIRTVEKENPTAAALLKLTCHDIKGACDSLERVGNYRLMILVSQLATAGKDWQDNIKKQIDAWREQGLLSEMTEDVRALYEICSGNVTICQGRSAAGTPVEDRAKTFCISEEFGLDWLQAFALGYWYGREEKRRVDDQDKTGVVKVEHAVAEFSGRCERREESEQPGGDVMWVLLKVFAAQRKVQGLQMPTFPQALGELNEVWDASAVFRFHFAVVAHVEGVSIDQEKADNLTDLLAWQLGSRGDLPGAIAVLIHLTDAQKRMEALKRLLERFAGSLPEPTSASTDKTDDGQSELWNTLTQQLCIPTAWLYIAKALHARAMDGDAHRELEYLVAAESWDDAHECLVRRVAPGCTVDEDYEALAEVVGLFGGDGDRKVQEWIIGGGVYADFVKLVTSRGKPDEILVESLRSRLVEMSRKLSKDSLGGADGGIDLGKLSIEELEERVALKEMARVVAGYMSDRRKEILELPITSDQRLAHTSAIAVEYYRSIMAGSS